MKNYEIRDPVYGFITFNDWEKEIINHVAFQRLIYVKSGDREVAEEALK